MLTYLLREVRGNTQTDTVITGYSNLEQRISDYMGEYFAKDDFPTSLTAYEWRTLSVVMRITFRMHIDDLPANDARQKVIPLRLPDDPF